MPLSLRVALLLSLSTTCAIAQTTTAIDPGLRTIADANKNLTGTPPHGIDWSPDGKLLTYIASDDDTTGKPGDIVQIEAATGHASVLATAEQLSKLTAAAVNEKDADHRARYGMSAYLWAADSKHLLLDNGGRLWLYDIAAGTGSLIVDTHEGSGDDPKFSPDARSVSYLHNHNLYVHPVAAQGKETALTRDTTDTLLNGEVDWVYLEELDVRSNYFWSPDSKSIAYLQMDEAKVPQYPITDWIPTHATIDSQRYPQPGDPNPAVRVGIVAAKGGKTKFLEVPFSPNNDYIPRFGWVDANTIYLEVLTRDQQHLNLYFADARSGKTRLVYTDTDAKYLDFSTDLSILPGGRFLIESWRDGHTHLYLYSFDEHHPLAADATLTRQLTQGDYEVEYVNSIKSGTDEKSSTVFFTSNEGSPLEDNLWSIKLDGSAKDQLTAGRGTHGTKTSPDGAHFTDYYSDAITPPVISLCNITRNCSPIWKSKPLPPATTVTSDIVSVTAADGKTKLYGRLTLPSPTTSPTSVSIPLILNPYNGPTPESSIRNSWSAGQIFNELLAQHGFAVLDVDTRGSGGRGRDFQQAAYRNFGPIQLSDQMAALDQILAQYPQLDPKRIGWWGWSWGGTFTLYSMTHTDRIRAGVAVAPVTDWRNYDSIYTERYLGIPASKPDVATDIYTLDSPTTNAANLKGRLLIAQGTGDDNVHMANTIQFLQPLIDAGIPYDLQLFPRKTHSIAGPTARDELFNRILWHFETYLKP
ncbi:DPP IV N-terminal domain-containing protein [Tunturiibacter empetritectus]|uniref:Dipeptidyl-peptidase-4 n=1 Tax=Tunturiibacter lichenicola TaxID=2051959 RepID=A0A852VEF8_9BACT|nr:DPP IV N-terminal domain-containing protein [Edaphobacter lichenicola]NYF91243.1 dipeptidyl-peptidase-4 [Edaphobacter lichenicola]